MFRKILFGAVSMIALAIGAAQADDIKEFRIGILGGENEADRLRNYQCLVRPAEEAARRRESVAVPGRRL